ncbi:YiiD C-terminal domain-containing protein [Mucilaginibacter roseus]|uniref:YiiD C-terminal domain-containing protein n=1 Tax=Mucilaginibacter roseus TaxID=1528868 RepID=A0ABS8U182_9SPHI|nr:DUF4442 domain-containing protein [Mucilaginibacter roseus]MCD8739818.1 YiiD C-terminal domain-containing protein [Mucilaginibacter roseus]
MVVSENTLKWAMRFYPPLLFQRVWVQKVEPGFTGITVTISNSLLNRNYNRSIFGGTLFAAADPFYPVLLHQLFSHKGYNVIAWLKSSTIQYLKPVRSKLWFSIKLSNSDVKAIEHDLKHIGKHVEHYPVEMYNDTGELCVTINNEVYLRNLDFVLQKEAVQ